jgi:drug/metabolite transporter (DMT)-like permease
VFSFMTPLFGVTLGMLILHEHVSLGFGLGACMVLSGIGLVTREAWRRARDARPAGVSEIDVRSLESEGR